MNLYRYTKTIISKVVTLCSPLFIVFLFISFYGNAQNGLNKNGKITNTSADFLNKYGAINSSEFLNKNGKSSLSSVTQNALRFSGTPDYATLPSGVYFNGNFTIECWVYPTAFTSWSRIIDFGNGAGNNNVLLSYTYGTSGKPAFYVGGSQFAATSAIPLNQWTHIAATLNGTTATIYINGSAAGTGNFPIPADVVRTKNYIGRSNWGTGDPDASAVFDDLRIWNVARSASEIQSKMYTELYGDELGLQVYFPFNEGIACGDNTTVTTIQDMAASGGYSNATLYDFEMNNGCESNFTNGNPQLKKIANGLTSATASSSAYAIKQAYPSSADGVYWIANANINGGTPFQIYADMTTDGGGWTLIMCNQSYVGWTHANTIYRNVNSPSISANYSIVGWADYIKKSTTGFQYMLDAHTRRSNGGIWTVNNNISFTSTSNASTIASGAITRNIKYGTWLEEDNGDNLGPRMPYYTSTNQAFLTTDGNDGGHWWGALVADDSTWVTAPWMSSYGVQKPEYIWYWVR